MRTQLIDNQRVFGAKANYTAAVNSKIKKLPWIYEGIKNKDSNFFSSQKTNIILEKLIKMLESNQIKPTRKHWEILTNYQKLKYYKMKNGDRLILATDINASAASPSAIMIKHGKDGEQGNTRIYRNPKTEKDIIFDKLAEVLNQKVKYNEAFFNFFKNIFQLKKAS